MSNDYSHDGIGQPARFAFEITPDDSNDLAIIPRALYVGVAGTLKVDMAGEGTVTLTAAQGYHPLRVKRVYATGTAATGIIGLY